MLFLILILVICVYLIFLLYKRCKVKLPRKNEKYVENDNEMCIEGIKNEPSAPALTKTIYGEMQLTRLNPTVPILHSARMDETECGGHRLKEVVKEEYIGYIDENLLSKFSSRKNRRSVKSRQFLISISHFSY